MNPRGSLRPQLRIVPFCLAAACFTAALNATAQDDAPQARDSASSDRSEDAKRSSARQLATEASIDYRSGKFDAAYDKFNRAFRLVGVPALGVWSARALRQQNRLVEASERYRDVLKTGAEEDAPQSYLQALKDARAELDELLPTIPNLTIQLTNAEPTDVNVTLDGEAVDAALLGVKQRVDPGEHEVVGTRGSEVVRETITLQPRQAESLTLEFRPGYVARQTLDGEAKEDSARGGLSGLQVAGIATMASAGAFLIGGGVTTALALGKQSDLQAACTNGVCPPGSHGDVDSFNTLKTLSTLGLIGGAVLGATGITLFVVGSPKQEEQPGLALSFTGNGALLRGSF